MTAKRRLTFKILLFLIFTDLLETLAQFCFKKGAMSANLFASPFLWLGLAAVLFIFITWVTILSKVDLSVAVPVASFSYITIPVVSTIFLHEYISKMRWLGIFCILIGVILVSASSRHKERGA